jgi:glyoxylase-like metal-dependent hydrolase (beta-lactamase superfamily II)
MPSGESSPDDSPGPIHPSVGKEACVSIKTTVDDVTDDVIRIRYLFVNVYMVQTASGWVLIDAALHGSADEIITAAEARFGEGVAPDAIILTHGHFDHVGAFPEIFDRWDVPIYAHPTELPFLTGQQDYPEPDPTVGKGAMALLSFAYPNKANDFGKRVQSLPDDGSVPFMPGWRWIHTPGHTAGHVSLFRDADALLIAGDAFVTTQQESLYEVMQQKKGVHGPPAYFTPDWSAARESVERLAALHPAIAATGHGTPMSGDELQSGLDELVAHFDEVAVPDRGKYVDSAGSSNA